MRATAGIVVVIFTGILMGCDGSSSRSLPTQPSAVTPPAGPETTGLVTDSAFRPLAGARVEVLDGPQAGASTLTDTRGAFRFAAVFAAGTRFRATKEGHVMATETWAVNCPSCGITLRLASDRASIDMTGQYTLTLAADNTCTEPTGDLRSRTYAATVVPLELPDLPAHTAFAVTLGDPSVLAEYNHFSIHTAGDYVTFYFQNAGPALVEQTAETSFLAFRGIGGAAVGSSSVSTIATTFEGWMHSCTLASHVFSWNGCDIAPGHAGCLSKNNRLTFTKR
jgi:Carboxypeptidase regulatory-like domain